MDDNFFLGSGVIKYPQECGTGEVNTDSSHRRRSTSLYCSHVHDYNITTYCFQSIYSLYMTTVNHDVLLLKCLFTSF